MRVLGITGGVGAGKSEVLHYLETEYGAVVCQLDEVARRRQAKGQTCFSRIVEAFGTEILGEDGELDRERLGALVFSDGVRLQKLNEIVHPEVKQWVRQDISRKEQEGVSLYVIESALLPDAGYEEICGEMWFIYTEEQVRRERLMKFRGYTEERVMQMIRSQASEQRFRSTCPVVVDNSGAFEDTKRQIGELL